MSEEVTYATLKFPNSSKSKKLQESCGLNRTELELNGVAESEPETAENIVEVAESRAMRGHCKLWKVWGPVFFIVLLLNLVVMAGLGSLMLMNYQELLFSNRTAYDGQQSKTEQLERNIALCLNVYKNISNEHTVFKNMLENTLKALNNYTSKYYEKSEKTQKSDPECCSSSKPCTCQGESGMNSPLLRCDSEKSGNGTQLFITCLSSPVSGKDLNLTSFKSKENPDNASKIYNLTCLASF